LTLRRQVVVDGQQELVVDLHANRAHAHAGRIALDPACTRSSATLAAGARIDVTVLMSGALVARFTSSPCALS